MANLASKTFTATGTWVAPAGVTQAMLVGWGGGDGTGTSGNGGDGDGGGGGGGDGGAGGTGQLTITWIE